MFCNIQGSDDTGFQLYCSSAVVCFWFSLNILNAIASIQVTRHGLVQY